MLPLFLECSFVKLDHNLLECQLFQIGSYAESAFWGKYFFLYMQKNHEPNGNLKVTCLHCKRMTRSHLMARFYFNFKICEIARRIEGNGVWASGVEEADVNICCSKV